MTEKDVDSSRRHSPPLECLRFIFPWKSCVRFDLFENSEDESRQFDLELQTSSNHQRLDKVSENASDELPPSNEENVTLAEDSVFSDNLCSLQKAVDVVVVKQAEIANLDERNGHMESSTASSAITAAELFVSPSLQVWGHGSEANSKAEAIPDHCKQIETFEKFDTAPPPATTGFTSLNFPEVKPNITVGKEGLPENDALFENKLDIFSAPVLSKRGEPSQSFLLTINGGGGKPVRSRSSSPLRPSMISTSSQRNEKPFGQVGSAAGGLPQSPQSPRVPPAATAVQEKPAMLDDMAFEPLLERRRSSSPLRASMISPTRYRTEEGIVGKKVLSSADPYSAIMKQNELTIKEEKRSKR